MTVHRLKTWPVAYEPAAQGLKPWEVRLNDRDYKVDDVVVREEFWIEPDAQNYTGRRIAGRITFLLPGGQFGIEKGYVVMTLEPCELPDE